MEGIMELLYLWINKSENNVFVHQQVTLSPEFDICVDETSLPREIRIKRNLNYNLFKLKNIDNLTAIIGSNGSGKSTLMSYIANNDVIKPSRTGLGYERLYEEEYELYKSIHVYFDKKSNKLLIYHNLENQIEVHNDTDYDFCIKYYTGNQDSSEPLFEIHDQTIVYLSNSYYVHDSFNCFKTAEKIRNYNLHPTILEQISKTFYKSLFGLGLLDSVKSVKSDFSEEIINNKSSRHFQQILDIVYYKFLLDSKAFGSKDMIGEKFKRLYITFDYLPGILKKQKSIVMNDKINEFLKKYSYQKFVSKSIINVLYLNLLFEIYCSTNDFILPDVDLEKENLYEAIIPIIKSGKYTEYLDEIHRIEKILSRCETYENLIDNSEDLSIRKDRIIDYEKNPKIYIDFVEFIFNLYKSQNSYILRYLNINNLNMSSGERAIQNIFSWLISIPSFEKI